MLTVGSLFSGIGGFDLGLERAGMRIIWQSEIDPYASAVLRKHWPNVPNLGDIRNITAAAPRVDVICGGFPCQDISNAGKRAGIDGERSGLWSEYARVIGELRPRYVLVENVSALLGRGLERVLGDLAALGFDAEWHCIPASAIGAPHRRDRIWIIAHARSEGRRQELRGSHGDEGAHEGRAAQHMLKPGGYGAERDVADAECIDGRPRRTRGSDPSGSRQSEPVRSLPHATHDTALGDGIRRGDAAGQWWTEPDVGRVAHGVPARVDRLRCLGNAIVPQCAEVIGRAIMRLA